MGSRQIARVSGVSRPVVRALLDGTVTAIWRSTETRLLATEVELAPGTLTNSWWPRRHVQAVRAEGFTVRDLMTRGGVSKPYFGPRVRRATAAKVEAIYLTWLS